MIERFIFGTMTMPGEGVRIALAIIGTAAAAYFDVFNRKNVPDNLLYGFVIMAMLANIVFFDQDVVVFGAAISAVIFIVGYSFYRLGQIGGADVFVLTAISLLLPVVPSYIKMPFNYPFIFPVVVFSGALFAVYALLYFGYRLMKVESKPNKIAFLLFLPYAIFAYVFLNSMLFSPFYFAIISIMMIVSIFFYAYKNDIEKLLVEKVGLDDIEEEEVLALDRMDKKIVEKFKLQRLLTKKELERLKAFKVKELAELPIYKNLPPFLPFTLLGLLLALLYAHALILTFGY